METGDVAEVGLPRIKEDISAGSLDFLVSGASVDPQQERVVLWGLFTSSSYGTALGFFIPLKQSSSKTILSLAFHFQDQLSSNPWVARFLWVSQYSASFLQIKPLVNFYSKSILVHGYESVVRLLSSTCEIWSPTNTGLTSAGSTFVVILCHHRYASKQPSVPPPGQHSNNEKKHHKGKGEEESKISSFNCTT